MTAPAIIYIVAMLIAAPFAWRNHNKRVKHNFWVDVVVQGFALGLLYWGGFFT